MCLGRTLPWERAAFPVPAQILASMCVGGLVSCIIPNDISTANAAFSPGTSIARRAPIEMFMSAQLVIVVLMFAAGKSKDTFIAPLESA